MDMTLKGFVWYQGENNMGNVKGNAMDGVGYACAMKQLITGYRAAWSATPGTTDPLAPFGVVALPSGGSEGGPNMGAMRVAQTASHGVLPNADLPNTFIAQAYDLEDQWGSGDGPCFATPATHGPKEAWACCAGKGYNATQCAGREARCAPACAAAAGTSMVMGGIHPRSKKPVGDRLARGAFNTVYGGTGSITGPTLASCAVAGSSLTIEFDKALLRGDTIVLQPAFPSVQTRYVTYGGTLLWALTNKTTYCIEPKCAVNQTSGQCASAPTGRGLLGDYCPTWAGGDGVTVLPTGAFSAGWVELNFTLSPSGTGIVADLAPLNGSAPVGIRYAWDSLFCCDLTDPTLYVTHDCIAECPIMSSARLPANPFNAKIVDGACACQAPQVCS
jgi:sialate O-acetylesterase